MGAAVLVLVVAVGPATVPQVGVGAVLVHVAEVGAVTVLVDPVSLGVGGARVDARVGVGAVRGRGAAVEIGVVVVAPRRGRAARRRGGGRRREIPCRRSNTCLRNNRPLWKLIRN